MSGTIAFHAEHWHWEEISRSHSDTRNRDGIARVHGMGNVQAEELVE
jgi:hypothetical protein